jgi:hypothetical protein
MPVKGNTSIASGGCWFMYRWEAGKTWSRYGEPDAYLMSGDAIGFCVKEAQTDKEKRMLSFHVYGF